MQPIHHLPLQQDTQMPAAGRSLSEHAAASARLGTRDQVETWVNEGGTGDDVSG